MNKLDELAIEHEVKLRVQKEVNDEKFKAIDDTHQDIKRELKEIIKHVDSKFNMIIAIVVVGVFIPVILQFWKGV